MKNNHLLTYTLKLLLTGVFLFAIIIQPLKANFLVDFKVIRSTLMPDSVLIRNTTQGTSLMIKGTDNLQLVFNNTDVEDIQAGNANLSIFPNPIQTCSTIKFYNTNVAPITTAVYDIAGRLVVRNTLPGTIGWIAQQVSGLKSGQYIVKVSVNNMIMSQSLLSVGTDGNYPIILSTGITESATGNKVKYKSTSTNTVEMNYKAGDVLSFKGYIHKTDTSIVETTVTHNQTVSFDFITVFKGAMTYTSHETWSTFFQTFGFLTPDQIVLDRMASQTGYTSVYGFNIPVENQQVGFKWNTEDTQSENWYPQSISGFYWNSRRFLVVGWYANDYQGSRISLVDITDMNNIKYCNILLVQSRGTQTSTEYTQLKKYIPLAIHAGGIAYNKGKLYVASTDLGIRVFDMSKLIEVTTENADSYLGWDDSANKIYAFGYRYILPQVGYYKITEGAPFSCLSLSFGETADDERLTTGQYLTTGHPLVYSFFLNTDGSIDMTKNPEITDPVDMYGGPCYHVQGVFTKYGKTFLVQTGNSYYEGSTARLSKSVSGTTTVRYRWAHGGEDLYYERSKDLLWDLTEYPTSKYSQDNRCVFAVKLSDYW